MAKKNKKKKIGSADLAVMAVRELDKGNPKQGLKHAKVCYRQDRSEATRTLLQRAFLLRGKELHARSMFEHARSTIVEMDELGEISAEYKDDAARLRALLGVGGSGSDESVVTKEIRQELADQAVVFGPASVTQKDLQNSARIIREALKAVEADESGRAVDLVATIDRDSPFSDWKLFLRGLVAYYEQDEQRMQANWSRLEPDRAARRIAEALSVVAGQQSYRDASSALRGKIDGLARTLGSSLVGELRQLQRKLQDPNCNQALLYSEVRRFMSVHAQSKPIAAHRLAEILVQRAIDHEDTDEEDLARLKRVLPKLPLDPHLNRAFALMHELLDDLHVAERYWNAYVKDLRACQDLNESQRSTAIALVYQRLAIQRAEEAADTIDSPYHSITAGDSRQTLLQKAERYLHDSCKSDPTLVEVQLERASMLELLERQEETAECYRQLVHQFPDNFDTVLAATRYFLRHDQPGVAQQYAQAARDLRPRDDAALGLAWSSFVGTAREAAKVNQYRLAEAELAKADQLTGPDRPAYIVLSIRAAVAFKDGNCENGEKFTQQTAEQFETPVAALLLVHSQAKRCGVKDRVVLTSLKTRLAKEMKARKKNSQAAGVMALYVRSLQACGVEYQGLATHVQQVTTYLNQSVRLKWSPEHLRNACQFAMDGKLQPLLSKLAKRGCKLFSNDPYFYYFQGQAEILRGPADCNFSVANKALSKAIELSNAGDIKLDPACCQEASRSLRLLEFGPPPAFSDLFDMVDFDDEQDDLDLDGRKLKMLIDTMPPELKSQLEKEGVAPEDAVKVMAKIMRMA